MNQKIIYSMVLIGGILAASLPRSSFASAPEISGHIESTYMYDFNKSSTQAVPLRSFDPTGNSFYLNAAHIALNGSLEEGVSYTIEVDYGSDAQYINGQKDVEIQEGYLTFPVGPLAVTAGKFVTYEGIEVIEGPDNPTISRGYLFGLAEAFGHMGVKAHVNVGDHINIGVGYVNGRDQNTDNNKGKTAIWRVGLDFGSPFSVGLSGSHGSVNDNNPASNVDEDNLTSFDLTGSLGIIPRFPIAFQFLYAEQDNAKLGTSLLGKWSGIGLQPTLELTQVFSIGARVEYIDDLDRSNFTATNYTLTPACKVNEAIVVRAEVRRDIVNSTGNPGPFVDDKGRSKGTSTTMSLGISYHF